MLFVLPLGILFYFFDKKTRKENEKLFESFEQRLRDQNDLSREQKLQRLDEMYYANGFRRVLLDESHLIVEKKFFNLGVLLILFGLMSYFGILFYIIYYRYFLRPYQKVVRL